MFATYQPPTLYAPRTGTWRISFYCIHPQTEKLERIQKTFDLNRIRCRKERKKVAVEIMNQVYRALKYGYNYFIDTAGIVDNNCTAHGTGVGKVVTELLQSRITGRKPRTRDTYRSYNNVFTEWLQETGIYNLPCQAFTYIHFEQFIDYKIAQGCGNGNINDYIGYFRSIFKKAKKRRLIKENPIDDIDYLPNTDSTLFQPLTAEELKIISPHLQKVNIRYYIYTKFTSCEFVRPYHTAFIKAGDIDYKNELIAINDTSSKNSKVKYKQLMPELKKLLIEYEYHKLPGHYYLFAKEFQPSPTAYPRLSKTSAEFWREQVINGLGIPKKMYCLKHTAGTYFVNENEKADTGWLQAQMEHHSPAQTEVYIKTKKVKKLDSQAKLIDY